MARARRKLQPLLAEYAPHADEVFEEQPMTGSPRTRFLHVANGTSTTMTIEAAGIPGACSLWADPLYDGPVPGGLSDAELLEVRMQYLDLGGPGDPSNDLRQWRAAITCFLQEYPWTTDGHVLRGEVALTETGRSVLAGQLDRVAVCGIDRWLGGVHLQSGGVLWRWDETRQRVVRSTIRPN